MATTERGCRFLSRCLVCLIALAVLVEGQGRVRWQMGIFGVSEENALVTICADYPDAVAGFTVETSTTDFFAINGTDYIFQIGPPSYLVWPANSTRACLDIQIVDDEKVENDEIFYVNMVRVVESPGGTTPQLESQTIIMIMDDDLIPIVFMNGTSITTTDDIPSVKVCVGVKGDLVGETVSYRIPIAVATDGDTAEPGRDFETFNNMTVGDRSRAVFTPPRPIACFTLSLLNRQDNELDDRSFFVEVMLRSGMAMINPPPDQIKLPESDLEIVIQPAAQIEVGDIIDSVLSNPLFSVTLDMEGTQPDSNLCYEVHGESNRTLNLVSDTCFSINARYEAIPVANGYNKIDKLYITASDAVGLCNNILIEASSCSNRAILVVHSDAARVLTGRYRRNGLQVDVLGGSIEVTLPCQRYPGGGIKVVAKCKSQYQHPVTGQLLAVSNLDVVFQRGKLSPTVSPMPHGLLGQFWHLEFELESFTDPFVDGRSRDSAFKMTTPTDLGTRSFIGLMYHLTWDLRNQHCLYAGSRQAGTSHYVTSPADSIIEGDYSDYKVGVGQEEQSFSGFSTDYKYSVFPRDQYRCENLVQ